MAQAKDFNVFGDFLRSVNSSPVSSPSDNAVALTDADDIEGTVLRLVREGWLTVEAILSRTGLPLSAVLKVLDKMQSYRLLEIDPESGRILLTPHGEHVAEQLTRR